MIQKVDNKRTAVYTGVGLGVGAVAGGISGYLSNPHLKKGIVTDEFVSSYCDKEVTDELELMLKKSKQIKQISETGSIDNIPDDVLKDIADGGPSLKTLSKEERKAVVNQIIQEGYKEFGVDNWDDLIKRSKEDSLGELTVNKKKFIADYDNLLFAENTEREKMKEVFMKNSRKFRLDNKLPLDEAIDEIVDGKSVKEINQFILDQKQCEQEAFNNYRNLYKRKLTEYLTGKSPDGHVAKPGGMFDLTSDEGKRAAKRVDTLVRKGKLYAAGKWAAISGGVLALIGAGIALLTGNKET